MSNEQKVMSNEQKISASSITWTFASTVKTLASSGLLVSSISSEAINSAPELFINSSISSSLSRCTVSNNVNTCISGTTVSMKISFFGYYSFFNTFLIKFLQLHYNQYIWWIRITKHLWKSKNSQSAFM